MSQGNESTACSAIDRRTVEGRSDARPPRGGARPVDPAQKKVRLLSRDALDGRTFAAKKFDRITRGVEADLGGGEQLSTIERELVQAFAGAAVQINELNALCLLGKAIDLADYAVICSTMVRVASRLGISRRARDVSVLDPLEYARQRGDGDLAEAAP
jgi:hypothetical protein